MDSSLHVHDSASKRYVGPLTQILHTINSLFAFIARICVEGKQQGSVAGEGRMDGINKCNLLLFPYFNPSLFDKPSLLHGNIFL